MKLNFHGIDVNEAINYEQYHRARYEIEYPSERFIDPFYLMELITSSTCAGDWPNASYWLGRLHLIQTVPGPVDTSSPGD